MFATALGLSVCTDDGRARAAVANEIGSVRLTGSIGLLKSAVHQGLLSASDAYVAYQLMIASGGFLPRLPPHYF
jgi:predicted nucleic acid-binding protein